MRSSNTFAWTGEGSMFLPENTFGAIPAPDGQNYPIDPSRIYYTPLFVLNLSLVGNAYAMVHELAHYCSLNPGVKDHAYQHRNAGEFDSLPAFKRVRNADHYAMFVFEGATGSGTSPVRPFLDED